MLVGEWNMRIGKRWLVATLLLFSFGMEIPAFAVTSHRYRRHTSHYVVKKRSKKKSAAIIGGSAAGGAAIGALAGGGKGAAIGAIVGGAGGLIYDRKTHKKVVRTY